MSASNIKIMEPGAVGVGVNGAPAPAAVEGERLVVITGQPANINMAVQLLYHVRFDTFRTLKVNPRLIGFLSSDWSRRKLSKGAPSRTREEGDRPYDWS